MGAMLILAFPRCALSPPPPAGWAAPCLGRVGVVLVVSCLAVLLPCRAVPRAGVCRGFVGCSRVLGLSGPCPVGELHLWRAVG